MKLKDSKPKSVKDSLPSAEEASSKKPKKVETTGNRWAAFILLILTIVLSLVALIQGQLFAPSNSPKPSADPGNQWHFSADSQ